MRAYPCGWAVGFFDEPGHHEANCATCKARAKVDNGGKA